MFWAGYDPYFAKITAHVRNTLKSDSFGTDFLYGGNIDCFEQKAQNSYVEWDRLHGKKSCWSLNMTKSDMTFVKSFTQARFQPIWKFTPITRKPRHVLPPKTPYKSKQMCDSPTVLLRYALSLLYNIKLIKNYTKIFEITQKCLHQQNFYPTLKSFTQALLVMLVTKITSE